MDFKKSDCEVIDENAVIENLLNGDDKNGTEKFQKSSSGPKIVYSKQVGCLDLKSILINLIIYTVVLMVTSGWIGGFYLGSFLDAFNTAILMSILNILLKPILVLLTLPLTIMTFGLFYVVVNGFLLVIADYLMGTSFEITSFGVAVLASIFISLLRMAINHYFLKEDSLKVNL